MKVIKEMLISFLKVLQKFPYEKVIRCLESTINSPQNTGIQSALAETFYLTVTKGAVLINGLEIINDRAKSTYKIFSVLYDQFLEDHKDSKPCGEFRFLSLNSIAKFLEQVQLNVFSTEDQVRRPLNKLRKEIQRRLKERFGTDIGLNTLIEFVPWSNSSTNQFGFRINAANVLLKAA